MIELVYYDYPRTINLSNKRKPLYWKKKDKLPLKYSTKDFSFEDGVLVFNKTGEKVIKNWDVLDTPRTLTINGNLYKSLNLLPSHRNKINTTLKEYFRTQTQIELTPPIFIKFFFHTDRRDIEDINNYDKFYIDAFFDALIDYDIKMVKIPKQKTGKKQTSERIKKIAPFPDDCVDFIKGYSSEFVPSTERKLVIQLWNITQ